ncbi:MAG: 5'/3'-nucleotidase SurE [Myxococcales bacterium]
MTSRPVTSPNPTTIDDQSNTLKHRLVLSNDDGVHADGLATLHKILAPQANCLIVAPSGPQSGVGHAVTTKRPMALEELSLGRFGLDGTPADCARVALGGRATFARKILGDGATGSQAAGANAVESKSAREMAAGETGDAREIWLVAGINHGANLGMDVYISGTAAAAREATILGFPAIAISQYVGKHRKPDWEATALRAAQALDILFMRRPRPGTFWNVNLPHPADESTEHDIVFCPLDPSPHAFQYENRGGELHWISDFHNRPRLDGHDIATCMGGQIAISELPIQPFLENFA